jgi:hypothetical protein
MQIDDRTIPKLHGWIWLQSIIDFWDDWGSVLYIIESIDGKIGIPHILLNMHIFIIIRVSSFDDGLGGGCRFAERSRQ